MEDDAKLSKQRRWQLKQRSMGNCDQCGLPSPDKARCNQCAIKRGVNKPRHTKAEWDNVDWSLSIKQISKLMNAGHSCVHYQANLRGMQKPRGRPKKIAESNFMPPITCKSCRHWQPSEEPSWGACGNASNREMLRVLGGYFLCNENYGCVMAETEEDVTIPE